MLVISISISLDSSRFCQEMWQWTTKCHRKRPCIWQCNQPTTFSGYWISAIRQRVFFLLGCILRCFSAHQVLDSSNQTGFMDLLYQKKKKTISTHRTVGHSTFYCFSHHFVELQRLPCVIFPGDQQFIKYPNPAPATIMRLKSQKSHFSLNLRHF